METKGFGVAIGAGDTRVYDFSVLKKSFKVQDVLEDEVRIADEDLPSIIDQGHIGSCVACSLAEMLEFFNYLETGTKIKYSHPYIYGKHRSKDSTGWGMLVETALKSMMNCGSVPIDVWGRPAEMKEAKELVWDRKDLEELAKPTKIAGYCKIRWNNNADAAKQIYLAIKNTGTPIIATSQYAFGEPHCVMIYGVNVKTQEVYVQNSWGENWGEKGRIRMPVSNFENAYMIMDEVTALPFKDVPEDAWYYKAVANMYRAGYLNGKTEDTFDPDGYVRRSELAQVLNKILKHLDEIESARGDCLGNWIQKVEDRIGQN